MESGPILPTALDTPSSELFAQPKTYPAFTSRRHTLLSLLWAPHCPSSQLPQPLCLHSCPFLGLAQCPRLPQPGTQSCLRPSSAGDEPIKAGTCPSPHTQISPTPVAPEATGVSPQHPDTSSPMTHFPGGKTETPWLLSLDLSLPQVAQSLKGAPETAMEQVFIRQLGGQAFRDKSPRLPPTYQLYNLERVT